MFGGLFSDSRKLRQERIILEREQVKFNNQAQAIDKVIKSVK